MRREGLALTVERELAKCYERERVKWLEFSEKHGTPIEIEVPHWMLAKHFYDASPNSRWNLRLHPNLDAFSRGEKTVEEFLKVFTDEELLALYANWFADKFR